MIIYKDTSELQKNNNSEKMITSNIQELKIIKIFGVFHK